MNAIDKKTYEIAYALSRMAEKTGEPLGGILSNKGLQLLAAVVESDVLSASRLISALGYFIKLGSGLGRMTQGNADLLIGQLNLLTDMLNEGIDTATPLAAGLVQDVDLADIFSGNSDVSSVPIHPAIKKDAPEKLSSSVAGHPAIQNHKKEIKEITEVFEKKAAIEDGDGESSFAPLISSEIRQSEILDLVRQSGNCRMKDLQDMFPRCSERTLRYDIETLIGRRLIERVGAGSATSYQPIDLASVSDQSFE